MPPVTAERTVPFVITSKLKCNEVREYSTNGRLVFRTCAFEKKAMTLSLLRLTGHSFVFSLFLCKETLKPCKETLRTYLSIAHRSGFVFVWSMDLLCPSKPKRLLTEARYYLIANIPAVAGRIPQSKHGKKIASAATPSHSYQLDM